MEELDGDDGVLRDAQGNAARRDTVQFVEFRDAMRRGDLAEQVLKEVPQQLCDHMENIGFSLAPVAQVMPDM